MKYIQYFFITTLVFFSLIGCGDNNKTTTISFTGTAKDADNGNPISGVQVELASSETRSTSTDNNGKYVFENVEPGKYNLSFTATGYKYFETTITVGVGKMGNSSYNALLEKTGNGVSKASVTLKDYLAMSDGFYYRFTVNSDTKEYHWLHYKTSELPQNDDDIIKDLLSNGQPMFVGDTIGWGWSLAESTNYTLCIIASDAQGLKGALVKRQLTTRSSAYQPEAKITIRSISNGIVTYDITKNSYCDKYVLVLWYNLVEDELNEPNVYWAGQAYFDLSTEDGFMQNQNLSSQTWNMPNSLCLIVTLGYDANGNVSGVINKQAFSTVTNQILSSSALRSNGINANKSSGIIQQMTNIKKTK